MALAVLKTAKITAQQIGTPGVIATHGVVPNRMLEVHTTAVIAWCFFGRGLCEVQVQHRALVQQLRSIDQVGDSRGGKDQLYSFKLDFGD